jgi:hypothetical protein
MAPFDALAFGLPGATLFPWLFPAVSDSDAEIVPDDILEYEVLLVPEDWFGADSDSVAEYHDGLEAHAFGWDELGESLTALEAFCALERVWTDPYDPQNRFLRHCPQRDHGLFQRVVVVGQKALRLMSALISPEDEPKVQGIRWSVGVCGTHRYVRHGTLYLHRLIMMRMLHDDAALRGLMLKRFRLKPDRYGRVDVDVARLLNVGLVHHRNHDTADCRRVNLELVDAVANMRQAQQKPGAAGYIGVRRVGEGGRWRYAALVERSVRGRDWSRRLGVYPSPELAALARAWFLLGHPQYLTHTYTPTAKEAPVWAIAKAFIDGAELAGGLWLSDVRQHPGLMQLLDYARQQVSKGRAVEVRERDGGH